LTRLWLLRTFLKKLLIISINVGELLSFFLGVSHTIINLDTFTTNVEEVEHQTLEHRLELVILLRQDLGGVEELDDFAQDG